MEEVVEWEREVSRRLEAMLFKVKQKDPVEILVQISYSELDLRIVEQLPQNPEVKVNWVEDSGLSDGLVFFTGRHEGTRSTTKEAQWFPAPGLPVELWEKYAVYRNDTLHSLSREEAQEVVVNGWDDPLVVQPSDTHLDAVTGTGRIVQAAVRRYREAVRSAGLEEGILVLSAAPAVRRLLEGEHLRRLGVDLVETRSSGRKSEHFDRVNLLRRAPEGRALSNWESMLPGTVYVPPEGATPRQQEVYDRLRDDGVPIDRALSLAELLQ